MRAITRRKHGEVAARNAVLRLIGDGARKRPTTVAQRFAFAVNKTCDLRLSLLLRTRRMRPELSMLRSAITVVGSIIPTRVESSRWERPSLFHSTRRKYHCPRVTPYGAIRRSRRR